MLKINNLTTYLDKAILISDNRISALISHRCQGIEQIDFHGTQPVSRNAKLLYHPDGVLTFRLKCTLDSKVSEIPLRWENLSYHPAGIRTAQQIGLIRARLEVCVLKEKFAVRCTCTAQDEADMDWSTFKLQVCWNRKSMTTEVHGNRLWDVPDAINDHYRMLKCTDQIHLQEWL